MRIGIDVSQAVYQGSGVATYTVELVNHLVANFPQHEFVLFGVTLGQRKTLQLTFANINVKKRFYTLPHSSLGLMFNQLNLPIELLTGPLDVFHASDWVMPRSIKAKLVTTIHDLTTLKFPQFHHRKVVAAHQVRYDRIKRLNPWIIADSVATSKDISRYLMIDPERIDVAYLGVSPAMMAFATKDRATKSLLVDEVKQKHDLDQYLLFVGTSEPRKNLKRVIEAYRKIRPSFQKTQLVIVGKYGWGNRYLDEDGVRILGYLDQKEIPAIYSGAQVFVYPSLYEGFGLPILEAMSLGTPVVTSNRGSLSEVAGNGAVIVNPVSVDDISRGIVRALHERKQLRLAGFKQAAKFTWNDCAASTMAIYQKAYNE